MNVGDDISLDHPLAHSGGRVTLINRTPDASPGERLTLELVRNFARFHPESRILYLHTKGASHSTRTAQIDDWRRLMSHVVVENFSQCLAALEHHDAVGCELLDEPRRHFSGNFWWSTSQHLARLPEVGPDRHDAEWWVLSPPGVQACSLHDSGVNHYHERYPRGRYAEG